MRNKSVERGSRKANFLTIQPENYLIVCEGKETEPNYFNGLKKEINKKYKDKVDVLIPNIEVKGTGKNTTDIVKYTQQFVNYSSKIYGQVWVLFDKDDYSDEQFDKAINQCNYNVGWSNPNFELWLLLHLKKVNQYISKDNVLLELEKEFHKNELGNYKKNDKNIFNKIISKREIKDVIANCKELEKLNGNKKPSLRNPMTKVYRIVEGLQEYLK